jgi:hypothetical protein
LKNLSQAKRDEIKNKAPAEFPATNNLVKVSACQNGQASCG